MVLKTESVSKQFGGLKAVDSVSITLNENEILGLIGPNGAGKTTFINLVTGVLTVDSGRILFNNQDITKLPTNKRARLGIVRTFQILRPFSSLTVWDNIAIGLSSQFCSHLFSLLQRRNKKVVNAIVEDILMMTGLERWANQVAGALPVGVLRRLEIARALSLNPAVLLLDEPVAGLNDQEMKEMASLLPKLQQKYKISVLLVEHRMRFVMRVCQRIVVMHQGRVIAEGKPEEIAVNPYVIDVYLGRTGE